MPAPSFLHFFRGPERADPAVYPDLDRFFEARRAREAPDVLRRRIDDAAKVLPLDRLALSPQCGFASTVAGNPLTEDDQHRKLSRVVEVADAVWGSTQ